jgi:hypothetical protein
MANSVQLKRSSVTGAIPVAGTMEQGELAINLVDGYLFYKDHTNTVKRIKIAVEEVNGIDFTSSFLLMGA